MAQDYKIKELPSLSALQPGDKAEVEVEELDAKVLLVNAGREGLAHRPKINHYGAPLKNGVVTTDGN